MSKKNPPAPKTVPTKAASPSIEAAAFSSLPLVYSAQIAHAQVSTSPLPPPEMLRAYEAVSPGMVDRLVHMAEAEATHRRVMEAEVLMIQSRDQKAFRRSEVLGQVFGLTIGVVAIVAAAVVSMHGYQVAGSLIGTTGVSGLVAAFITGRTLLLKQKRQEFEQAQQAQRHDKPPAV